MLHAIANDRLTVAVDDLGAQLWSIRSADGAEYLWQGDPTYWSDRALTIFPYVARLWQGCYEMDGETHALPIHGFAPTSRFALTEKTDACMVLSLTSNEETYAQYPRRFVFRVTYALEGNALNVMYEVENRDGRAMHFGLGGHPGFNVPLEPGHRFEDYRLRFGQACSPVRVGFTEDCFVSGADTPFPLEDGTLLPLRHALFDDDAIVLRDMARSVTLEAPGGGRSVMVSSPDMPYLGIWHWPGKPASYVCIEPCARCPRGWGASPCWRSSPIWCTSRRGSAMRTAGRWSSAGHDAP